MRALVACAWTAFGVGLVLPNSATACTHLLAPEPSQAIPEKGFVVLVCAGACQDPAPPSVSVVLDVSGEALAGEVVRRGVDDKGQPWAVFRPTTPVIAGQTLIASIGATSPWSRWW